MTSRHEKQASRRWRDGFTLVEVMVASAILLISVIAVLSAFSYSRRTESLTENRLACMHIAREVMEKLRHESYSSTALDLGTGKTLPGYPRARGYYNVSQGGGVGEKKDIKVVIEWVEPTGMGQSVSLTTSQSRGLHK